MWIPDTLKADELATLRAAYWNDETPERRTLRASVGEALAVELYAAGLWLSDALYRRGLTELQTRSLVQAAGELAGFLWRNEHSQPWIAAATVLESPGEWYWLSVPERVKRWVSSASLDDPSDPILSGIRRRFGL